MKSLLDVAYDTLLIVCIALSVVRFFVDASTSIGDVLSDAIGISLLVLACLRVLIHHKKRNRANSQD